MSLTLAQLIERAKPTNADEIAELDAILRDHATAAGQTLADIVAAAERPVATAVHAAEQKVEHTLHSICSAVTHWTGQEIQNLEAMLKIHPNRLPNDPALVSNAPTGETGSGTQSPPIAVVAVQAPATEPATSNSTDSSPQSETNTSATGQAASSDAAQVQGAQ